jgi:hypothetical protein
MALTEHSCEHANDDLLNRVKLKAVTNEPQEMFPQDPF